VTRLAMALAVAVFPTIVCAQSTTPQVSKALRVTGERIVFLRAGISLPHSPGAMVLESAHEFDEGGLDSSVQYLTLDKAITGSAFVYFPGLADTGLTFLATDAIIRSRFGPGTKIDDDRTVTVAGIARAGRRVVYSGASDGRRATAAIFSRIGGWIVVLRASGPASRASDVLSQLDSMAAGMTVARPAKPAVARSLKTSDCPSPDAPDATVSASDNASAMAAALVVVGDHPSMADKTGVRLAPIPDELCLAATSTSTNVITLDYRPVSAIGKNRSAQWVRLHGDGGLALIAIPALNDASKINIVRYTTGGFAIYGIFGGLPSRRQLDEMTNREGGLQPVVEGVFGPTGNSDINIICNRTREGCVGTKAKAK
jgi:hypothetical protein